MKNEQRVLARIAGVLSAVLVTLLLAQSAAWAEQTKWSRDFSLGSGDACGYGGAEGTVIWRRPGPLIPSVVDVKGVVVDQVDSFCESDGYLTIIEFTAYNGDRVVNTGAASVNNDRREFRLRLEGATQARVSRPNIDRLSARICRQPEIHIGSPPHYCGPMRTFVPGIGSAVRAEEVALH